MLHHRTRWFLRTVAVSATLTLGTGVGQVLLPRSAPRTAPVPVLVAAPASAPAEVLVTTPRVQDDELPLRRATTARPAPPARVVVARPRPAPPPRPRPKPHATRKQQSRPTATFEQELRRAVDRIPFYQPGIARWVVRRGLPNYGLTDRSARIVYISPRVPRARLYDVVAHEWAHVISTQGYGGNLRTADAAVLRWFGGGSTTRAIEIAADCVARVLGARWTNYTSCANTHLSYGARYLMVGWKLPEEQASA